MVALHAFVLVVTMSLFRAQILLQASLLANLCTYFPEHGGWCIFAGRMQLRSEHVGWCTSLSCSGGEWLLHNLAVNDSGQMDMF